MEELEAVLVDIAEMTEAIVELRKKLFEILAKIAAELPTETERVEAARYLYWTQSEVSPQAIAQMLGTGIGRLRRLVGPAITDILCDRCGCSVPFRSRTQLQEYLREERTSPRIVRYAEGYSITCKDCWAAVQRKREEEWKILEEQISSRLRELRTMPYREYLRTPEWQERRGRHLKSAGFRCQVCNAADTQLDVHHRTYERRGGEYFKDLIALCHSCHELFHREGRLAYD